MSVSLPLGTPTKVIDAVSLSPSASTTVEVLPVLSLVNELTLQVIPGNVDGLVGRLMGSLDGVNYTVLLCEVGSPTGYTSKLFGPIKTMELTVTNYGSSTVSATAWMAVRLG
jgi:hypothetical protein